VTVCIEFSQTLPLFARGRTANFAGHEEANSCLHSELFTRISHPFPWITSAEKINFIIYWYCKRVIKPLSFGTLPEIGCR
jgi:hypothetical protein